MTEAITVYEKPLKHWNGLFNPPNLIILKSNLSPTEKATTLKHELMHYNFYLKHKLLRGFFHFRFRLIYTAIMLTTLIFSPLTYLLLTIPLTVMAIHEIDTSLKAGFKKRISQTVLGLFLTYSLFFAIPLVLRGFGK